VGGIRVLLVDDEPGVLFACREYLTRAGMTVVATCGSSEAALLEASRTAADVAVIDIGMPDLTGDRLSPELRRKAPGPRFVVFTGVTDGLAQELALRAGAEGLVAKPGSKELACAIESVVKGAPYFCANSQKHLSVFLARASSGASLPPMQVKVFQAAAEGMTDKEIAIALGISPQTVHTHMKRAIAALGAHGRKDAAARAKALGLLPPTTIDETLR